MVARGFSALALTVAGVLAGSAGCVTPIEVKQASKAQLDLLGALDTAAATLQRSLDEFHEANRQRILQDGRIRVARQAIDVAYPEGSKAKVTADALFAGHKKTVQPWIDSAFQGTTLDAQLHELDLKLQKVTDPALRIQLTNQKQDIEKRKQELGTPPEAVQKMAKTVGDALDAETKTADSTDKALQILRAQIALMKALASRVDAWLAIDVAVTQNQADALRSSFDAATKALGGAK